ncbi:double homeobox protein 4C-like [Sigmodon hispidus]
MEDVRNVSDYSTVAQESRRRKRSVWEAWQKEALLKAFGKNPSPSFGARQDLARELGLPECRVRIWFQNRRCRTRQVRQGPRGSEDPSMLAEPQRSEEPGARAQGRRHTEQGCTRLRTRLSSAQLKILLQAFERDPKPPYAAREQLAQRTALPEDTIQIWFQNRRARCSSRRPLTFPSTKAVAGEELPCRTRWLQQSSGSSLKDCLAGRLSLPRTAPYHWLQQQQQQLWAPIP